MTLKKDVCMAQAFKGNRLYSSTNTNYNALDFFIRNSINTMINTALPVKVVEVIEKEIQGSQKTSGEEGSSQKQIYVSLLPLLQQYDANGEALRQSIIYNVPTFSLQSGKAAIIMKPEINDIGIAIFSQQDITKLSNIPQKPLSYRSFSIADAMYIGSLQGMNKTEPEIYIKFLQEGEIEIHAKEKIFIKSDNLSIEAENMQIKGDIEVEGKLEVSENITTSKDVIADEISLKNHRHGNVEGGNSQTGAAL